MKKTLTTLLALGTVAAAADAPIVYDAYILHMNDTSTKLTELTTNRGQLWFNEDGATLSSWMIEFDITKLTTSNKTLFSNSFGTTAATDERYGLGVYAWYNYSGVTIGVDDAHYSAAQNVTFPDSSTSNLPVTLRLAYDAQTQTAYLYCVDSGAGTEVTFTGENVAYTLTSATLGGTKDQTGVSSFWTDAGANTYSISTVTDLSALAGDSTAFAYYVKNGKVIPEPATTTLSLLALVGLAARRRRK